MHGEYVGKDKNGFNLYNRICKKCGKINAVHKPSLEKICRACANSKRAKKHGLSSHRLYGLWEGMVSRCHCSSCYSYRYYGKKGIKVSKEWRLNPETFIEWAIENGYNLGLEIDRIDPDGDYEPKNCRFISASKNRSRARQASKLSAEQVKEIRERLKNGEKGIDLAAQYDTDHSNISCIKLRKTWKMI